jgi:hypothetical protein
MYWLPIILIIAGVLSCFWGYRIFKIVLGILGFFLGAYLAGYVVYGWSDGNELFTIIAAIVGGIIGGSLITFLYFVGVFLLGASGAWILTLMISDGGGYAVNLVVMIVLAVIGGVLALIFQKLIIILSTSFSGSWAVFSGIYFFVGGGFHSIDVFRDPRILLRYSEEASPLALILWLVLAVAGVIFQHRSTVGGKIREEQ